MKHERARKAWEPMERSALSGNERSAWNDLNAQRRSNAGMVSPFLSGSTTSEHERTRLRDSHGNQQAYERARLGFIKERDATPNDHRDSLVEAKVVERLRLGFCEERTKASDQVWQSEKETKVEERSRLGMLDERSSLNSARRRGLAEGAYESRARLGMHVHSPRHPLSRGDPFHRDVATQELRAKVFETSDNLRTRSGMTNERTASAGSFDRGGFFDRQREQRDRLGFVETHVGVGARESPDRHPNVLTRAVLRERNGRKAEREVTCKI